MFLCLFYIQHVYVSNVLESLRCLPMTGLRGGSCGKGILSMLEGGGLRSIMVP